MNGMAPLLCRRCGDWETRCDCPRYTTTHAPLAGPGLCCDGCGATYNQHLWSPFGPPICPPNGREDD